jgi:GNAT superfamily N-acetyltransferase
VTVVVTTADRPDLDLEVLQEDWPRFLFHDPVAAEYLDRVQSYFTRYSVLLLDDDSVVAGGWAVPLDWDGRRLPEGYDGALAKAVTGHGSVRPNTLCVMAAAVASDRQGWGLAGEVITALRERAVEDGLERAIAPVRPTLKSRYPLTPMARFATWTRDDGLHLDPWIRTHQRLGATILAPAPRSMVITGTVAQWEQWAGMAFPESGEYVVPDALDLVTIDRARDLGTYAETNLWMRHR